LQPRLLEQLLARLDEALPQANVLDADDVAFADESSVKQLEESGFLKPISPSLSILCPACGTGHLADVHWMEGETPYVTCLEEGTVKVDPKGLRRWQFDLCSLAKLVDCTYAEMLPQRLYQLHPTTQSMRFRSVFLACGLAWPDAERLYRAVRQTAGSNEAVVLFPATGPANPPSDLVFVPLAQRSHEMPLTLNELVPGDRERRTSETHAMTRRGRIWQLRFEGEPAVIRDTAGLQYIAILLQSPRKELAAIELVALRRGDSLSAQADLQDLRATSDSDFGESIDDETRNQAHRRLRELQDEVREARELGQDQLEESLLGEMEKIEIYLRSATRLGGRSRRSGSTKERARGSVTSAIKGAIVAINDELPSLAVHLEAALQTGSFCSYQPEEEPPWQISR
jgi:hypothetical protein